MPDETYYPPLSPLGTGLAGRCPRCGEGRLFKGLLTVAPACDHCGLDYSFADSGDGPAVLLILVLGFVIVGGALWLEFTFMPPIWVQALVWIPLTLVLGVGLLKPLKGLTIAQQYATRAAEGRLNSGGGDH